MDRLDTLLYEYAPRELWLDTYRSDDSEGLP